MKEKEEAIKRAWAGFYNPQVSLENGWMNIRPGTYSNDNFFDRLKFNSEKHSIRPKSLSGLDNNNGWIKIETESDLPKEKPIDVIIDGSPYQGWIFKNKIGIFCHVCNRYVQSPVIVDVRNAKSITHYREIEFKELPIY